jgi:hypothetical protein
LIGPAFAFCQGVGPLEIPISSAFAVPDTPAICNGSGTYDIWGAISVTAYGGSLYVTVPTNAPDGTALTYFRDNGTGDIFRNDTAVLPIRSGNSSLANLVLATGGLVSSGGQFYGQVAGIELDTADLRSGNVTYDAVIYLNSLPSGAAYTMSLSDDSQARQTISGMAQGVSGNIVSPMISLTGMSNDSQGSIEFMILRMEYGSLSADGNVSAYRYANGMLSKLPCEAIASADGTYYEAIAPGPGVFAFDGNFPSPPPEGPGVSGVLEFAGALAAVLLGLVGVTLVAFKKISRRKN